MNLPRTRLMAVIAIGAIVALLAACAPSAGGSDNADETTLSLVGYSIPKIGNTAAFEAFGNTDAGKGVAWKESYGASGDQSRAVAGGLKADYVNLSLEPDVARLVEAGLVDKDWKAGPNKGIVTGSVVAL